MVTALLQNKRRQRIKLILRLEFEGFKKCFSSTSTERAGYKHCEFDNDKILSKVKNEEEGEVSESNKGVKFLVIFLVNSYGWYL